MPTPVDEDPKFGKDHDGLARVSAWSGMGAAFYAAQAVTIIADRLHASGVLTNKDIEMMQLSLALWQGHDNAWKDILKSDSADRIAEQLTKMRQRGSTVSS